MVSSLHFSTGCILVLISKNKYWFAKRSEWSIATNSNSWLATLPWTLQISQLWALLLSLWPIFLLCPLSYGCPKPVACSLPPHKFCWAWSFFWILLLSQYREFHPKSHTFSKDSHAVKCLAPSLTPGRVLPKVKDLTRDASIIPPVRAACLVTATAVSLSMPHSKPVTNLQIVSFH